MVSTILLSLAVASTLSSVNLLAPTINAHQVVLLPQPQWVESNSSIRHNPLAFLEGQGFMPDDDFNAYLTSHNYKSLRDFMDNGKYKVVPGVDFKCGLTDPKGKAQPIPKDNAMRSSGYTHIGPCEVWLDDTMVLSGKNCNKEFPGKDYTIDYSSCKDKCILYWFWMGVRFVKKNWSWQVYKACIPLTTKGEYSDEKKKLRQ